MAFSVRTSGRAIARLPEPQPAVRGNISPTTLIRDVYRALLSRGRVYAAFTEEERVLVAKLRSQGPILDPMSGYGGLARYGAEVGANTFCVEINPAQYLWQVLCNPVHLAYQVNAIECVLAHRRTWPRESQSASASDDWYPPESIRLLKSLYASVVAALPPRPRNDQFDPAIRASAMIAPIAGRLSASVPGDTSAHIKRGGICVYRGWRDDFELYLTFLRRLLKGFLAAHATSAHQLQLGDARLFRFPRNHFAAMITSPPYPNRHDFIRVFEVENELLRILCPTHPIGAGCDTAIGSVFVRGRSAREPQTSAAKRFLREALLRPTDQRSRYDDTTYYLPYFRQYLAELEEAYRNISTAASRSFEGYITIVNNTHRGLVVPVSDVVLETWRSLGFKVGVHRRAEIFHVGTKNPRARGIRAKHTKYVLKVWR